jgi:xanthine/uracil/vitamin C permease (AzgA family)
MKDFEGILVGIGLLLSGIYMKLLEYKIIPDKSACECKPSTLMKIPGWVLIICGIGFILLSMI